MNTHWLYQMLKGSTVNFGNDTVVAALQTIFDEINAVFPSPYVHCGGDEVSLPSIENTPEVKAQLKEFGLNSTTDLKVAP
jgi:hexosaminidase